MDLKAIIEETASITAEKTLAKLKSAGKVRYHRASSFRKTEELLYLYPKLSSDKRAPIEKALELIRDDDYFGVIESRYFDRMTIAEIAEIYDVKYQTISKKRNKLVKVLASELFPEDVMREIMGS